MMPSLFNMPFEGRISPTKMLLLLQLKRGPRYGYEMLKTLRDAFDGVWEPKTGAIYPALKSLQEHELVDIEERDGVEYYRLTGKGDALLKILAERIKSSLAYTWRYIRFLVTWTPADLKDTMMDMMGILASEGIATDPSFIAIFDDQPRSSKRQQVLTDLKRVLSNRLETVEKLIQAAKSPDEA